MAGCHGSREGGATGHLLGSRRHATSFVLVPSDGMFGEESKRGGEVLTHCFSRSQGIASSESAGTTPSVSSLIWASMFSGKV